MTLQEIESFLAVVQKGNLTEAAQFLHITQPSLTHRLKSLEQEIGSELVIRGKGIRTIELTPAGAGFIPLAEKWARLWKETTDMAERSKKQTLRIAATTTLSSYVMPEVYSRFVGRGLPVILDINTLHSEQAYKAVEQNDMDIAFVARTMPSRRVSSVPVFSERMVLLCRNDSHYNGVIHPSRLPADKCVYLYWTHAYFLWHEQWFGTNNYAVDADNMILAERIVAGSDLWMITPITAASVAVNREPLKIVELEEGPPNRTIYSLSHPLQNPYVDLLKTDLLNTVKIMGVSIMETPG